MSDSNGVENALQIKGNVEKQADLEENVYLLQYSFKIKKCPFTT